MGYTPPYLELRKVAGGWAIYPPDTTTTDDLTIYSNLTDALPKIVLEGATRLALYNGSGVALNVYDAATLAFRLKYSGTDYELESVIADKNLSLITNGTGKVKFGTYSAGAATDSTGYISILDAAGNARKLMVQA